METWDSGAERSGAVLATAKGVRSKGTLILAVVTAVACSGQPTAPTPIPLVLGRESWFFYPVICFGCPGLTNVEVDHSAIPTRLTLSVGKLTSLRAKSLDRCVAQAEDPNVLRWISSDPSVVRFEPTGSGSTLVFALAPGLTRITAERLMPDGRIDVVGISDPYRSATACAPQPEVLFQVLP